MRKIASLLILLAILTGSLALDPPPLRVTQAAPPRAAAGDLAPRAYLPVVSRQLSACSPIPGVAYGTLSINGLPTDRPAHLHADLNLALRGYEVTSAYLGLVDYGGGEDPNAPQLPALFSPNRVPSFPTAYKVYDWNWPTNSRGALLDTWPVTLLGMGVAPTEVIHLPDSGYDIGSGYEALVLYATEERITLKYTREDNVVHGYTVHIENICVEPSLLALYQAWNEAGRSRLPALRGGQPLGRARGSEIGVATRDNGNFMDPRSRKDWWVAR
jgi:hypothetical protein